MTLRESRGLEIVHAKERQVSRVDEFLYVVKSQSGNGEYTVNKVDGEWTALVQATHTDKLNVNIFLQ